MLGPILLGTIVAVLLAVTRHWLPAALLIPLAILPAVLFVWYERRAAAPVFTHTANSIAANVTAFGAGVAFLGAETYLPLQLQVGFAHGIDLPGYTLSACAWSASPCSCARSAGRPGRWVPPRVNSRPRNQIMLGTVLTFAATACHGDPGGGASVPVLGYAVSGLGMGIASPALFTAVLADGGEGREGRATSSIPLDPAGRLGHGCGHRRHRLRRDAQSHQITAAEHAGAHVPAVVHAARLSYLAVTAVSAIGVVACFWLRRDSGGPGRAERSLPEVAEFPTAGAGSEPAVRGSG